MNERVKRKVVMMVVMMTTAPKYIQEQLLALVRSQWWVRPVVRSSMTMPT